MRPGRSADAAPASHSEQPGSVETRHQPDDDGEERPLPWGPVPTLLSTDTYGVPIFSPSQMPVVQLQVNLQRLAPTLSHTPSATPLSYRPLSYRPLSYRPLSCRPLSYRPRLQVKLRAPLLYWSEKNRWLWHKKWTLPKIDVRVTFAPPGTQQQWSGPPVSVILSATTMPHSQEPARQHVGRAT